MRATPSTKLFEGDRRLGSVFIKAKLPFFSTGDVAAFGSGADISRRLGRRGLRPPRRVGRLLHPRPRRRWVLCRQPSATTCTPVCRTSTANRPSTPCSRASDPPRHPAGDKRGRRFFTNSVYRHQRRDKRRDIVGLHRPRRTGYRHRRRQELLRLFWSTASVELHPESRSGTEALVAKNQRAGVSAKCLRQERRHGFPVRVGRRRRGVQGDDDAMSHLGWIERRRRRAAYHPP